MLVTHVEVEKYFGVICTPDEIDMLNVSALPNAQSAIEAYLHRPLEATSVLAELHEVGFTTQQFTLRQSPVVLVTAVRLEHTALLTTSYDVYGQVVQLLNWGPVGRPIGMDEFWTRHVEVDYVAGLTTVHPNAVRIARGIMVGRGIRALVRRRGQLSMIEENKLGVKSLSVEGYSITWDASVLATDADIPVLDATEQAALQRYRRRVLR